MKNVFAVSLLIHLFAVVAFAHKGEVHTYLGTVTMLQKDGSFMMKRTDGKNMTVLTSKSTKYLHADDHAAKRSELAKDMRVVVKIAKDGKTALSVKMSPAKKK
jgi:hypothetical protein